MLLLLLLFLLLFWLVLRSNRHDFPIIKEEGAIEQGLVCHFVVMNPVHLIQVHDCSLSAPPCSKLRRTCQNGLELLYLVLIEKVVLQKAAFL